MIKTTLGNLLEVYRGTSVKSDFFETNSNKSIFIRLTLGNFKYPLGGFKLNSSKDDIYYSGIFNRKFLLKKDDLITPLTEQTYGLLGETAFIPEDDIFIHTSDIGLVVTDETKLLKKYAYYLISSNLIKKQLSSKAQQTKIRHTSASAIKECISFIPSLYRQQHIVDNIRKGSVLT